MQMREAKKQGKRPVEATVQPTQPKPGSNAPEPPPRKEVPPSIFGADFSAPGEPTF
jgi:hypothetical protein